jgi:D-arabinose 1-dehydrogenase-like Zn-dependent alcohol dehydrogenase
MRAITVIPGKPGSVTLTDMPEPPGEDGPVLVQTQAIGVCGTDLEIINGEYGSAPPGEDRLIIGHESLGRVVQAEPGSGFGAGDLVVGIVRRRDPVPCPACAVGHWDMCMNGRYTERGIVGRHGYASVLFGSVNANRRHYELAAQALAQADRGWLADLITRREPLTRWADAYARQPDDIKTILTFPGE